MNEQKPSQSNSTHSWQVEAATPGWGVGSRTPGILHEALSGSIILSLGTTFAIVFVFSPLSCSLPPVKDLALGVQHPKTRLAHAYENL